MGRRALLYSLWGKNSFLRLRCIRARACGLPWGLHDLILFDGWYHLDVRGCSGEKFPLGSCRPRANGPGVYQAVSVDPEGNNIKPECVVAVDAGMDGPGTHPGHRDSCPSVRLSL